MNLLDEIKKIHEEQPEEMLKIGAGDTGGTAYFFIGTAGEYMEQEDKVEGMAFGQTWRKLRRSIEALEYEMRGANKKQFANWAAKNRNKITTENAVEYAWKLIDFQVECSKGKLKNIQGKRATLRGAVERMEEYTPVSTREVIEVFQSDPIVDCSTVIMIHGHENGTMWMVSERKDDGKEETGA